MTAKKDPNLTRAEALSLAWKSRKSYKGYERGVGTMFNSWRSITNTEKGRSIGFPETWKDFSVFRDEVAGEWQLGKIVCRYDTKEPHSKTNSYWAEKGTENSGRLVRVEYNGEEKTLLEWCAQLSLNYQGVRQRYFRGKGLTTKEVLFGKEKKTRTPRDRDFAFKTLRKLGAYRLRDSKKGFVSDLTIDYFRSLIAQGCVYCGDADRVGLDRIDNKLGHSVANVVPCCYVCNCARNDNFSHEEMKEIGSVIKRIKEKRNANK